MGKGKGRAFPESYRALAPGRKLSWLGGEECKSLVDAGKLLASNVQAEVLRLERQRLRISRIAPTPARVDDYQAGEPFPPRAEHTPMRTADVVANESIERETLWPRNYLRGTRGRVAIYDVLVFQDEKRKQAAGMPHSLNVGKPKEPWTTESPSAVAMQNMAETLDRIVEQKLAPESLEALRQEINYTLQTGRLTTQAVTL